MQIEKFHHVAFRCNDAKETVEWYKKYLNMDFILAFAEDLVPSTKSPDPYMHIFLDAGMGNVLAFFELPTQPKMDRDRNTPDWVQHIAFQVKDEEELLKYKKHLEDLDVELIGVTNHSLFHSIYFFDPNGHRLELTYPDPDAPSMIERLNDVKWEMLEEWSQTKKAPKHAEWLHSDEFEKA